METRIWFSGSWRNIKPTDSITTTRGMHCFCIFNNIPDALFKTQGGWYLLQKDNTLKFIGKTLQDITFEQLYCLHIKQENEPRIK